MISFILYKVLHCTSVVKGLSKVDYLDENDRASMVRKIKMFSMVRGRSAM